MKIVGVIPARYKSSRFPGKPLASICGKPMIWWVYQQVMKVPDFSDVVVATDDERIEDTCKKLGIKAMRTSDTHPTGTDRVAEVADNIEADFYVNIQGDEPLIDPEAISAVINYYIDHKDVKVINTMTAIKSSEEMQSNTVVKVVFSDTYQIVYLSRSLVPYCKGVLDVGYYKHMGLYGLTRDMLRFFACTPRGRIEKAEDIEMFRFIENNIPIKVLPLDVQTMAVDRPEDINKVESKLRGDSDE